MPTWGELLKEIEQERTKDKLFAFDNVRRKYLLKLNQKTGRDTILYSTRWTETSSVIDPESVSLTFEDLSGLMEVIHGLKGPKLDIILHSPGGLAEATEAMVKYIRTKFADVRVIIPQMAMSAATMLACSANEIVMGKHSFLGPIDPQMLMQTELGVKAVPAHDVIKQFQMAKEECKDPNNLGSWMPILRQYGPALLIECENAIKLSISLVSEWLSKYMFKSDAALEGTASATALYLSNHDNFFTHARPIDRAAARGLGLKIVDLEEDQEFQDLVLSVFHAASHTFSATGAVKIIENHHGKAYIKTIPIPQGPLPGEVPQPPKSQMK